MLTYIGVFVGLTVAVVLLAQVGEVIRAGTPTSMHEPLSVAGAVIVTAGILSLVTFEVPPFAMSVLAWRISMIAGIAVGLLMFCFYVSGIECEHTGRRSACHFTGYK
ncbi:hypothetical protein GCM10011487_09510 [Steroidobacter agaridevorans]|uniref:Uncharacterized protein n=1 Tax=Steroidobacter agaridevorans TaxID=2695856 RepID=A0A829Y7G7_9GAMM|nr:hypothetical protein GCM10011487_09510 [Steroidobacter agaridevorans]GFE88106.1 hypothetical protein GCM10011488_30600 [Steroidobacter agaridevorans]